MVTSVHWPMVTKLVLSSITGADRERPKVKAMSSPRLILALWVVQPLIQAAIATVFYRRRLHKEFPAFFYYIVAQIPMFFVEFLVYRRASQGTYFHIYWALAGVDLIFAFKIIHEIFLDIFKPYHALRDLGSAMFKWAAVIMVLLSVALIAVTPSWEDPLANSILVVQRCVQVVQSGLVIFLLAFCRSLGVNWRRMSFGIALGFGLTSASDLISTALYSGGRMHTPTTQLVIMVSYNVGMLVLLLYSTLNRRSAMAPVLVPQRWDEALMDIQPQSEGESLIPMFEHMVDQALSKTDHARA